MGMTKENASPNQNSFLKSYRFDYYAMYSDLFIIFLWDLFSIQPDLNVINL